MIARPKGPTAVPVVLVGGSSGGLDAYIRLLQHLPVDMGLAIVIVNHLRNVETMLHQILPRYTTMPVELITEKLAVQPNHVFIIPSNRDLQVFDGEFRLKPISKPRGWPDVITVFLRSLTRHWHGKLIAVIVSGYDGDGAAALCEIKEIGGTTIAQQLGSAGQPDMPQSAAPATRRRSSRPAAHHEKSCRRGDESGWPDLPRSYHRARTRDS